MTAADDLFAAAQRDAKARTVERDAAERRESDMPDADDLMAAAAGLMVKAVCPLCKDWEVAVVRDSKYGPLLLWEAPTDASAMWMKITFAKRAKSLIVTEVPGHDPRKQRVRVLDPRGPGALPHPNARYVRRLKGDDDWTDDDLHCRHHGALSLGRSQVMAAVDRFQSRGRVDRIAATITYEAQRPW